MQLKQIKIDQYLLRGFGNSSPGVIVASELTLRIRQGGLSRMLRAWTSKMVYKSY